jgi:tetratricopeptide (TPR) repeat protein
VVRRRSIWVASSGLALLAAVLLFGVQRVPPGQVGVGAAGVAAPGWHLVAPWARLRLLPASGSVHCPGIELRTPEGARFTFTLEADYQIGSAVAGRLGEDLHRHGLEAATATLARSVLEDLARRTDVEAILADPALIEARVAAASGAAGVALGRVRMLSDVADAVLLRRRTEEARARSQPMPHRVLVIGLDGADWETLDPLMRAGALPNLARLVREGARGDLRSYDPMLSPLLWTTMATGKPPDQHGIADFLVKDKTTGRRRPITSDFRKVKALWNAMTELDRPSSWLAWWASYPAESIAGTKVTELLAYTVVRSGREAAASRPHLAWPEDYLARHKDALVPLTEVRLEEVRRILPWLTEADFREAQRRAAIEEPQDPNDKKPQEPVPFVLKLLCAARNYHALALEQLRAGSPFVAVYYEGIDMMGHRFQHCMEPRMAQCADADFARFAEAVPSYLRYQDAQIGELLEAAGRDTVTVLVSDHGFKAGSRRPKDIAPYTTGMPAEWHRAWGVLLLHGPGIRQGTLPRASVYDVAPTLLYLSGLPLAEDMPGRPVLAAFTRPQPAAQIRSYELVGKPLARDRAAPLDPEATEEMMSNLRALGYVGGGETSPPAVAPGETAAEGEADTQVYYHRNLATSLIKRGDLRAAEAELVAANERQPFPKTYAMLSEVRATQGRFAEAAQALRDGFAVIPEQMNPHAVLWMVEMDLRAGSADQAVADTRTYGNRASEGVRIAIDGRMQEARGNRPAAAEAYARALAAEPLLTSALLRLQGLYRAAGEPDRIVPYLERGLAAAADADLYHNLLGEHARAKGDLAGALTHFGAAVDLQPENGLYLGNQASALAALGRAPEARETLAWAERWDPREPEAWLAIAGAHDRLGDTDGALAAFRRAKERGAPEAAADAGTAVVLARAGRQEEARRVLAESLARHPDDPTLRSLAARLGARPF